jgi:8-oxo-dGTP pyrophosphatase MutT (NUDIX family)
MFGEAGVTRQVVPARPAAAIILVKDDPMRVLMIERHRDLVFGSAIVFPGGSVDPDDAALDWLAVADEAPDEPAERAFRVAACREMFEETGILLGAVVNLGDGGSFSNALRCSGGRLPLGDLHPVGHWRTPEHAAKRFDMRLYLCRAPEGQEAQCDGREAVSAEWIEPKESIALADARKCVLLFPTRMALKRLSESPSVDAAIVAARKLTPFVVMPTVERTERGIRLTIPAEAGYGVTEFWPEERGAILRNMANSKSG